MSQYNNFSDAPNKIKIEGRGIELVWNKTSATAGTLSWNIPAPAAGCTAATRAYNGIILTADTTAATVLTNPLNTTSYQSDPTVDTNLFAGDKIGTAMVVGTFYNNIITASLDITGLDPNKVYYFSAYAVDNVFQYHTEGVHSYSQEVQSQYKVAPSPGYQTIVLQPSGVLPSDGTGLDPSESYTVNIIVNNIPYQIEVSGIDSQTYTSLFAQLQKQFSLMTNPAVGENPPSTNALYYNKSQQILSAWTGSTHQAVSNVIYLNQDPMTSGYFWYDLSNKTLQLLDSTLNWQSYNYITSTNDPTNLQPTDYWIRNWNDNISYYRDGNVWCEVAQTFNQITDPSISISFSTGTYWYDITTDVIYQWGVIKEVWTTTNPIIWAVNPNILTAGTYWFNDVTNTLQQYNAGSWVSLNVTIQATQPIPATNLQYWYNPNAEVLKQYSQVTGLWTIIEILVFDTDPTIRGSCDLWWDTISSTLNIWDDIGLTWTPVNSLIEQAADPSLPLTLTINGATWINQGTQSVQLWDGGKWQNINTIIYATDPSIITTGDIWYNPTALIWNQYSASATWVEINPTTAATDPASPAADSYWYDTLTSTLHSWSGSTWITVTYSSTPLTPSSGSQWFNTITDKLMQWDGTQYIITTPIVNVSLDKIGNIKFTTTAAGGMQSVALGQHKYVQLGVSTGIGSIAPPQTATLDQSFSGQTSVSLPSPMIGLKWAGTLFTALKGISPLFLDPFPGDDGVSGIPSYEEVGVGSDGTDMTRRELADIIHTRLGGPTVAIEVTHDQINKAIDISLNLYRRDASWSYFRRFFFMDLLSGQQQYYLTNKEVGFNRIVNVLGCYRISSAFLSSAAGSGAFGQIIVQQLYSMGTFNLLSYFEMTNYISQLEQLFSVRIVFQWTEANRRLDMMQVPIQGRERILVECSVERTEQDLMRDRYSGQWIQNRALAETMLILARGARGKFATLPGAGGTIQLNANDLRMEAKDLIERCDKEILDYIADKPEELGLNASITWG